MRVKMAAAPALAFLLALSACSDRLTQPTGSDLLDSPAAVKLTLVPLRGTGAEMVRDGYIVWLRDDTRDVAAVARGLSTVNGAAVHFLYEHTIKGFAATLPPAAVAALRRNPQVKAISPDAIVTAYTTASWGLDRVDERNLPLDDSFTPFGQGAGVNVYVLDGGIMSAHSDFGGRVTTGYPDAYDAFRSTSDPNYAEDCWAQDRNYSLAINGHGTHVAGTIGGATYGVANGVHLTSIRVLKCDRSGTVSSITAGVDWIAAHHTDPAVVNASLGGNATVADFLPLEAAIRASVADGITYVVAAGNDTADACGVSPARMPETITVGASNINDARASFSNYGSCVDIFAPGENITSAYPLNSSGLEDVNGSAVMDGTSMAAPHVTGTAALYLSDHPSATPAQVRDYLLEEATRGVLSDVRTGSPNRLLFVPAPLSGSFSGPGRVSGGQTYTWTSTVSGGDGAYTYEWARRYRPGGIPGDWFVVGTGPTLTMRVSNLSSDFDLRLTVTSAQMQVTDTHLIFGACEQTTCPYAPQPTIPAGG
ncbi:MAG TPA: S8 family serine peptidase [Longimicrobiaceae bacterium]|nr:S8 family serine peptidase [Longimicrobiaceae bacterium]